MNQRQKELAIVALELGATVWISVDGDVCAAWLAGDNTALDFYATCTGGEGDVHFQRLSISGADHDVVSF